MMLSHALDANHETVAWCTANGLATEQRRGVPTRMMLAQPLFWLYLCTHRVPPSLTIETWPQVSWIGVPGWSSITASMARRSASARPIAGSFFNLNVIARGERCVGHRSEIQASVIS